VKDHATQFFSIVYLTLNSHLSKSFYIIPSRNKYPFYHSGVVDSALKRNVEVLGNFFFSKTNF
jgi:uncharacterized membrane protein YecN with MAPEG domain